MGPEGSYAAAVLIGASLCALAVLLILLTPGSRGSQAFQVRVFTVSFLTRFGLAFLLYEIGVLRIIEEPDARVWLTGAALYRGWEREGLGLLDIPAAILPGFDRHGGYKYLLAIFFYVTGAPYRIAAAALNCFFGALAIVLVYRATRLLFSEKVSTRVAWLSCFFPSLIVWSAQTLKEPVVVFLEALALYCCIMLAQRGFTMRHVIVSVVAIVSLLMFRFYAAYVAGATLFLTLAWPYRTHRRHAAASLATAALMLVPIVMLSGIFAVQQVRIEQLDIQYIERFRENVARNEATGVRTSYDMETPQGFVMATAIGAAHLLLAPFPWQLAGNSQRMMAVLPELLVWWALVFVGFFPGLLFCIRRRFSDTLPVLAFVTGLGLLHSLMFGNIGLAYRQRAQLLPWLFIFAMVGLELRAHRRAQAAIGSRRAPAAGSPPVTASG